MKLFNFAKLLTDSFSETNWNPMPDIFWVPSQKRKFKMRIGSQVNFAPAQPEGTPSGGASNPSGQVSASSSRQDDNLPTARQSSSNTSPPREPFPYGNDLNAMTEWFKKNDSDFASTAAAGAELATTAEKSVAEAKKRVEEFDKSNSQPASKASEPTTEELEKAMKEAFFKGDLSKSK